MLLPTKKIKLRRNQTSLCHQRGVVLVAALFIVALVVTMSYAMLARLARDTRRTELLVRAIQAELYAQGGVVWAMDQLRTDWQKQQRGHLIDATPIHSTTNKEQGYEIVSTIYDLQARFNLNNLSNPDARADFKRFLQTMSPDLAPEKINDMVLATVDWITPNGQKSLYDDYYLSLPTPYRAAHRSMLNASEFRLVKGVTPPLFNAIRSYLVALPAPTLVNVQSAHAPVLVTLSPAMTLETAKIIEQLRAKSPFISLEHFLNLDIVRSHPVLAAKVTVVSQYFLVVTEVSIENQRLMLYTLLARQVNAANLSIHILWQSKGTW